MIHYAWKRRKAASLLLETAFCIDFKGLAKRPILESLSLRHNPVSTPFKSIKYKRIISLARHPRIHIVSRIARFPSKTPVLPNYGDSPNYGISSLILASLPLRDAQLCPVAPQTQSGPRKPQRACTAYARGIEGSGPLSNCRGSSGPPMGIERSQPLHATTRAGLFAGP